MITYKTNTTDVEVANKMIRMGYIILRVERINQYDVKFTMYKVKKRNK